MLTGKKLPPPPPALRRLHSRHQRAMHPGLPPVGRVNRLLEPGRSGYLPETTEADTPDAIEAEVYRRYYAVFTE